MTLAIILPDEGVVESTNTGADHATRNGHYLDQVKKLKRWPRGGRRKHACLEVSGVSPRSDTLILSTGTYIFLEG
jgi:hypothetical protein